MQFEDSLSFAPRIFTGYSQDIPRILSGYTKDIPRIFSGFSKDIPRIFLGYSPDILKIFSGYSQDILRIFPGYFLIIPTFHIDRLTGKEKRIGSFDLIWDDGPVMAEEGGIDCINNTSYSTNSFLGKQPPFYDTQLYKQYLLFHKLFPW